MSTGGSGHGADTASVCDTPATTGGEGPNSGPSALQVLVIDLGGTSATLWMTGVAAPRSIPTGPGFTPDQLVWSVSQTAADWSYERISFGYPGAVRDGAIGREPHNLGIGWRSYDFAAAFRLPLRLINDAAMQALGCYRGGRLLYLGFGTGMGSAMVIEGVVQPMHLSSLPYRSKLTFGDHLANRGLEQMGLGAWRRAATAAVRVLSAALEPDDVVLGGGNARLLDDLPPGTRLAPDNDAFIGGYRLWAGADAEV